MENDFGEGAFLDYFLQQRRHVGAQEHPKSFRIRKVIIINVIIINVFLLGGGGGGGGLLSIAGSFSRKAIIIVIKANYFDS